MPTSASAAVLSLALTAAPAVTLAQSGVAAAAISVEPSHVEAGTFYRGATLTVRGSAGASSQIVVRTVEGSARQTYNRRGRIAGGAALDGAGKRAAFALFYGPLHFLLVRAIVAALPHALERQRTIVDLGCGTGAAGAAWAAACRRAPRVIGIDRHPWALEEAARTYRAFGLQARTERAPIGGRRLPKEPASFVAAFTVNELDEPAPIERQSRPFVATEATDVESVVELARRASDAA